MGEAPGPGMVWPPPPSRLDSCAPCPSKSVDCRIRPGRAGGKNSQPASWLGLWQQLPKKASTWRSQQHSGGLVGRIAAHVGALFDLSWTWMHTQKRTAQSNRAQRSEDMQQRSPFFSCTYPGPGRKTDLRNPDPLAVHTNYPRPFSDGH
jgi:hypothetical protein